ARIMKNIVISFLLISSFELFASEVIMNSPQYSKELKAFQNPPNPLQKGSPSMAFWDKIGTLKKVFFDKASRIPHEKLPSVKPNMDEFLSPSEHMKFIWFGHSSLL